MFSGEKTCCKSLDALFSSCCQLCLMSYHKKYHNMEGIFTNQLNSEKAKVKIHTDEVLKMILYTKTGKRLFIYAPVCALRRLSWINVN